MDAHGILDKIFYDENITLSECKKLAGDGLGKIRKARIELKKLDQKKLDLANEYQKEMALNRFEYAKDILMMAADNGYSILYLFWNSTGIIDPPFLTDVQCLKLARLSGFSYRDIRSEFSTKDASFMANFGK